MSDVDFAKLIDQVRTGDKQAAGTLVELYGEELRLMIRARMPRLLRPKFDSLDFAQDVWRSLLLGETPKTPELLDPDHLRRYLYGVVRHKLNEEYRRRTRTEKYELAREEPLTVRKGDREVVRDLPSRDPTPSARQHAVDRLTQLASGFRPHERRMIELRSQGLTFREIADEVGYDEKTVRKVLDEVARRREERG